ncbi:phosphodiester glycosidase family protein [Cribrihabitans marinus]|uniref:phosphodiester glycosidase family protein n=1 Tax=Cribrihabitans marinus TaxID=1227549 RepID=UPI000B851394|nr:phosphodiester glycosidase family protein [Cribrihabitans marinus]
MRAVLAALAAAFWAESAAAVECRALDSGGNSFTICEVDATRADLRLFLRAPDGSILGQFPAVDRQLADEGRKLEFAMNAGMYHEDRAPVGHYIENGEEEMRVIASAGPGNFGLLPNGVFCIRDGRADVIETGDYLEQAPDCRFATQSGPMLVIDGALHPRFLEDSTSRYIRNGVGTSADGSRVVFAISENPVTFHQFGTLFRDVLKTPQALYFDGNVSRLYAPGIDRADGGFPLGPIVGIAVPAE